ncbi:hypothetical protein FRX31_034279 [Thalictrum thalictroides]|uniref:CCHC-type domain-containing protein n=1 Tax=Thalictrum thalictroides TaxID=46969 RepID=A0A7J6UU53_THATH|nr:hypothetical protein FRX31_034279 [Thalictrum thalictroides]
MSQSSFNPLASILKDNKLSGPNYVDWKRNLNIVLTADNYKYVLTTPCPAVPPANANARQREEYEKWQKANEMSKCYILASMSNVLQHRHQNFATATEIMENLQEMFGEQNRAKRQIAMKNLMSTKMAEGTPVREHILKMIDYINELEILGAVIDANSQVDAVLQSLPESFNQFKLNYNMNNMQLSLSELMNSLQQAEDLVKKQPSVMISENVNEHKPKGKGKFNKGKKFSIGGPRGGIKKPTKAGKANGKGNCFHCGKPNHWKRNCRVYLASLKKDNKEGVSDEKKVE